MQLHFHSADSDHQDPYKKQQLIKISTGKSPQIKPEQESSSTFTATKPIVKENGKL